MLAAADAWCAVEAQAADAPQTKQPQATASTATAASTPKTCTGVWDFIATDCQLTWYGRVGPTKICSPGPRRLRSAA